MTPYYEDDAVTLYHGDCREIDAWLAADVLVTDPPYGVHRTLYSRTTTNAAAFAGEELSGRASDRTLGPEHVKTRTEALGRWGNRPALVFGSWRAPRPEGTRMRLIWDRDRLGIGGVHVWRPCDEEIYVVGDWPNPRGRTGRYTSSVVRFQSYAMSNERPDHPTPKPVGLMELLVSDCPTGVIADPFAGSGSTLLAARAQGRRAIGVELEERYCEVIAKRFAQGALDFGGVA